MCIVFSLVIQFIYYKKILWCSSNKKQHIFLNLVAKIHLKYYKSVKLNAHIVFSN